MKYLVMCSVFVVVVGLMVSLIFGQMIFIFVDEIISGEEVNYVVLILIDLNVGFFCVQFQVLNVIVFVLIFFFVVLVDIINQIDLNFFDVVELVDGFLLVLISLLSIGFLLFFEDFNIMVDLFILFDGFGFVCVDLINIKFGMVMVDDFDFGMVIVEVVSVQLIGMLIIIVF